MKKKIYLLLTTTLLLACGDGNKPDKLIVPMPPKGKFHHGEKGCRGRGHHHRRLGEEMGRLFATEDISVLNPEFRALQPVGEALMARIKAAAPSGVTLSSEQEAEVTKLQSLADSVQEEAKKAGIFSLELKAWPEAITTNSSDYANTKAELEVYKAQLAEYKARNISSMTFKDFMSQLRSVGGRVHRQPGVKLDEASKYVLKIRHAVRGLLIQYKKAAEAYDRQITAFEKQVENKKAEIDKYLKIFEEEATGIDTFVQDTNNQGTLDLQEFNFDDAGDIQDIVKVIKDQEDNIKSGNLIGVVGAIYTALKNAGAKFNAADLTDKNKKDAKDAIEKALKSDVDLMPFFTVTSEPVAEPIISALSSGSIKGLSGNVSLRDARTSSTGRVDGRGLTVNGVSGQAVDLGMPLFVQLKGDVNGAKTTEAATGSVAYRLGNTVIGAIQGYANSGVGFGFDGRQLESSVVASHSFGGLFIEGQAGSISATNVHNSDWSGYRSQLTVGFDTSFVTPFVQISHRQLDRDGIHQLNETVGYAGLDMDIANLTADTYSINTRLLAKVGYGEQNWSQGSKDLGSTSGVRGSVEWTAGVNLNSGISFSTNLGLDTLSGSSAGLTVSLDR